MHKKQILVLSILATGIAIELILMASFVAGRGHSERALSTNSTVNPVGDLQNNAIGMNATPLYEEGAPITDEDHIPGSEPDFSDEPTPVFGFDEGAADYAFGDGVPDGMTTDDGFYLSDDGGLGYTQDDSYPAPYDDGDGGYYTDDEAYPAPPTLPAAPTDVLPTDVPADATATAAAATGTPVPTGTQARPTATQPAPRPTATATQSAPKPTATSPFEPARPTRAATATPVATGTPVTAATPVATGTPVATATPAPVQPTPTTIIPGGLVAVRAGDAPSLDGSGSDAAWEAAPELKITTRGGANDSAAQIAVRSLYDDENVYFLLTWDDPTQSFLRAPWEKQKDGSWKMLASPDQGDNDENEFSEDKLAFLWAARNFSRFSTQGCGSACHTGENPDVKPYGNMYAPEEDDLGDIWQWKSVRGVGQVDDQYLDSTRYSADNPSAGIHADGDDGGGYRWNRNDDEDAPEFMPPDGGEKDGSPGYILEDEKVPFDDKLFKAGDRVPGVITAPFRGDRGDIRAAWRYRDGRWTLELRRKLETGSSKDVQFDDLNETYFFGLATFDNSEVRHAMQDAVTPFVFKK